MNHAGLYIAVLIVILLSWLTKDELRELRQRVEELELRTPSSRP